MSVDISWLTESKPNMKRLFYFTKSNHAISAIKENQIKVSEFSTCNDVFELYHLSEKNKQARDKHRSWANDLEGRVRFVCLSEDWQSPILWGYYGDNGLGACLVVDVKTENLEKVHYLRSRVSTDIEGNLPSWGDARFKKFCARKSKIWWREKEHRLFVGPECALCPKEVNGRTIHFLKCGVELSIAGVINGPKAECVALQEAAIGASISYLQTRAAFTLFKVRAQENKKYWVKP